MFAVYTSNPIMTNLDYYYKITITGEAALFSHHYMITMIHLLILPSEYSFPGELKLL